MKATDLFFFPLAFAGLWIDFEAQHNMVRVYLHDHEASSNYCLRRDKSELFQGAGLVTNGCLAELPSSPHKKQPRAPYCDVGKVVRLKKSWGECFNECLVRQKVKEFEPPQFRCPTSDTLISYYEVPKWRNTEYAREFSCVSTQVTIAVLHWKIAAYTHIVLQRNNKETTHAGIWAAQNANHVLVLVCN